MESKTVQPFWNLQASDILPFILAIAILLLAYGLIRGAKNYLHIQAQYSAIVLISGVLAILVYLGSIGKVSEDGLIAIFGSLIGYVVGSIKSVATKEGSD